MRVGRTASREIPAEGGFSIAFRRYLAHGVAVGLRLPLPAENLTEISLPPTAEGLHAEERRHAAGLPIRQRIPWIGGRLALREAFRLLGVRPDVPLLPAPRGAPLLPPGFAGSVSHKFLNSHALAVALAARDADGSVGVDIEPLAPARPDIARLILTPEEAAEVAALPFPERWPAILLRFCLKEAIYKAVDPIWRQPLDFTDVTLSPTADGAARSSWNFNPPGGPLALETRWFIADGHILASARLQRPRTDHAAAEAASIAPANSMENAPASL